MSLLWAAVTDIISTGVRNAVGECYYSLEQYMND